MSRSPGELTRRTVRAFLWAVASFGGQRLITFVGTLVLARILVPADFGLVAAGMALLAYFEMALDLGVGSAVIQEQEEGITRRVETAFTLNVALGAVLTAAGALSAPLVAAFFQVPDEANLFRVLFLYLFIRSGGQIADAVLRRDLQFKLRMIAEVGRGAVRVAIAIPLALAGFGAWSIVVGMVVGEVVSTIVLWIAARFRPRLRLDRGAVRTLLGFGSMVLGVRLVSELSNHGDYLIVGNRLGPSDLGIYSIATRIPELVLATIFWLYGLVAFPAYSRTGAVDREKLKRGMLRAMQLTTLIGVTAAVGLAIVAHDAIHVLFSDRWAASVTPMAIIALAFAVTAVSVAASDILPAVGRPGVLFAINAVFLPPLLVALVLAAPYGLAAVAAVHLVSGLLYAPVLQYYVNREIGTTWGEVGRALGPAVSATVGVIAFAVPVVWLLEPGAVRLVATIVAGGLGAGAGVLAGGRQAIPEMAGILHAVGRGSAEPGE